jgi:nucleoside diphosphate kinase
MQIDALTADPAKQAAFTADTYFQESAGLLAACTDDPVGFSRQHALLLLKPDAVAARALLPAIDWLADNGFRIVADAPVRLTRHMARALWYFSWDVATPYRRWLADLMLPTTDSLMLLVRADPARHGATGPASVLLTAAKGPTNPDARSPGQLRYLLGRYCYLLNLAHTADEPADVLRELGVCFDDATLAELYTTALRGHDRSAAARELAGALYRQTPVRDLSFAPAAARLGTAVDRLLAGSELAGPARAELAAARRETGYRQLLETLWRYRIVPHRWDVVVAGAYVLPMRQHRPEPVPVP